MIRNLDEAADLDSKPGMMPTPEATWQTDRLTGRPATCAEARVLFEQYARDPAVSKYQPQPFSQLFTA